MHRLNAIGCYRYKTRKHVGRITLRRGLHPNQQAGSVHRANENENAVGRQRKAQHYYLPTYAFRLTDKIDETTHKLVKLTPLDE